MIVAVVAELIKSLATAELSVKTVSDPASGGKLWNVSATVDLSEPGAPAEKVSLAVARNLSCSESLLDNKNQSIHTRWNCLVSRQINGIEAIAGHLTINGKLAPPIPPHFPSLDRSMDVLKTDDETQSASQNSMGPPLPTPIPPPNVW